MPRQLRLTLAAWRGIVAKIDNERTRLTANTSLLYWVNAAIQSFLFRVQQASQTDALKTVVPQPPIFLLGFWRSGTTLLHELFCCDQRFGFPSTYACLNPCHFLLTESFIRGRTAQQKKRRPMDDMRYSWASPQEDEFAILALGAPSPYEALLVPSLMRSPGSLLDLRQRPREEQERWAETLKYFVSLLTIQQNKKLVLKSPSHGFRLPMLLSCFPGAKYVIIERNPYEVFASNLKLWRTLLDLYSLESFSQDEIESFVISAYVLHEQIIAEASCHIDAESLARASYEELLASPITQMERLYSELKLENFAYVRAQLEDYLARTADHRRNRFVLSPAQKARLDSVWGLLIQKKRYSWPSDRMTLTESLGGAS